MRRLGLLVALAGLIACGKSNEPAIDAFTPSSNPLLNNGRPADAVVGQLSFRGRDVGTTNAAGLNGPVAVASEAEPDGTIQIWVADSVNNRVLGWRTSSAVDLSDGAPADIVLGQVDDYSTNGRGLPPEFRLNNLGFVAIDPELRVYVSNGNDVYVYNNPFSDDALWDYELDDLGSGLGGPWKPVPFGDNLLAVHNGLEVRFYRRGSPARLTDSTDVGPDGVMPKATGCANIASVAGGSSNFYIGCTTSIGTCPQDIVAGDPTDCSADGANFTSPCYDSAGSCGVVYAYKYESDIDSDIDPNTGSGLPVNNTFPPVFSGFGTISDVEVDLNVIFVSDSRFRVLRLNAGEPSASSLLEDPNPGDLIEETRGTQNVWQATIVGSTAPGLDTAFGQADERAYVQNRGLTNGQLSSQGLGSATEVAVDRADGLLVVDGANQRVVRFSGALATPQTTASLLIGQPSFAFAFPNAIESTGFGQVESVAVDWATDTVYVSDSAANRILQFDGGLGSEMGAEADSVIGQNNFLGYLVNRGRINIDATTLSAPQGLYVDRATGDVFVKDSGTPTNQRALAFDDPASSATITGRQYGANATSTTGEITGTGGIASLGTSVYVTNGGEIRRYDAVGDTDTRRYGDGSSSGPNGIGFASGIDFDSNGSMYVADRSNNRILIFDEPNGDLLNAITADAVVGQADFTTTSGGTDRNKLNQPEGIAIDGQDRLWVADSGNNRVLLFAEPRATDPTTNLASATYVLGQPSFTTAAVQDDGDGLGSINAGTLTAPSDVATNQSGDVVYVADRGNNRVLRFTDSERLRFTEGPGVYDVAPGEVRTVAIGTNLTATLSLDRVNPEGSVALNGSVITFDASGARAGTEARAQILASTDGPPGQSIAAGITFKVVQGTNLPPSSPPGARTPEPRTDGGCECNGVSGPWLGFIGLLAFLRRRRRSRSDEM